MVYVLWVFMFFDSPALDVKTFGLGFWRLLYYFKCLEQTIDLAYPNKTTTPPGAQQ